MILDVNSSKKYDEWIGENAQFFSNLENDYDVTVDPGTQDLIELFCSWLVRRREIEELPETELCRRFCEDPLELVDVSESSDLVYDFIIRVT